jgi:signal transduction histidine kinase
VAVFSTNFAEFKSFKQPKRVETLGTIAAGIAHEFNNLLTVMQGSLEQLHCQVLDERGQRHLERADWAAKQAAQLTQLVLSFARPGSRQNQVVVDLNDVVREFGKMTRRAVPEEVSLVLEPAPEPLPVRLDPGQLELALLNLTRNAAHALSGDGRIVIRTSIGQSDGSGYQRTAEVSVCDDGIGMSPEIAQRVTDPFFTTKVNGQGTGLGLWMVQYFVASEGGKLEIDTAEGQGTTMRLIFPLSEGNLINLSRSQN